MNVLHAVTGRRFSRLGVVGLALALSACGDQRITTPAPDADPAQVVARSLASAMADDAVRHSVRDAMRFSEVDGHKIVLQDFLASAGGAPLLRASSRAAGLDVAGFRALVSRLPQMDFYMPVRNHRRTWRGDANIAVIAARDAVGDLDAYTPTGTVLRASRRSADGLPPFFYLEPAEPKRRRVGAQPATPGEVIEEPHDGRGSMVFVYRTPDGDSTVYDFSVMTPKERDALFSGGPDTTLVGEFEHYVCDNGACWTDAEFRFNTTYYSSTGAVLGSGTYYVNSLHPDEPDPYLLNAPIIYNRMLHGSSQRMYIHIIEEDRGDWGGHNLDDNCGAVTIYPSQNGSYHTYFDTSDCSGGVGRGALLDYAIDAQYKWTTKTSEPPPPPPSYSVTIQGPTSAAPNNVCTWYASTNVSDAQYLWYQNDTPVGNGAELTLGVSGSFTLMLQVWNSLGHGASTSISVNVQSGNGQCLAQ